MGKQKKDIIVSIVVLAAIITVCSIAWPPIRQQHLNQTLFDAIRHNDTPAVCAALAQGANPNASFIPRSDYDRYTTPKRRLLDWLHGQRLAPPDAIPALFEEIDWSGELPNGKYGFPPENVAIVEALLDAGADPNSRGRGGTMPILVAATMAGDKATVNSLLDRGTDVNTRSDSGFTPLMIAASFGKTRLVQTLLRRGADTNIQNRDGDTALMLVAGKGFSGTQNRPEIARLLLDRGADADLKDNKGEDALALVRRRLARHPLEADALSQVAALLERYGTSRKIIDRAGGG